MAAAEKQGPGRGALWMAGLGSVGWVAFILWLQRNLVAGLGATAPDPILLGGLVALLLVPVGTAFAVAGAFTTAARPTGAWPPVAAEDTLDGQEAALVGTATRLATLRAMMAEDVAALSTAGAGVAGHAEGLHAQSRGVVTRAESVLAAFDGLSERLPAIGEQADAAAALLDRAGSQADARLRALRALADELAAAFGTAEARGGAAAAALTAGLQAFSGAVTAVDQQAQDVSGLIATEAARAGAAGAEVLLAMREQVAAQSAELAASLSDARVTLDRIGSEAARVIAGRLDTVRTAAGAIEAQLAQQIDTTQTLAATAERSFQVLEQRLALSARTSQSTLDQLAARIGDINAATDAIAAPLRAGRVAASELDTAVGALRENVMQTVDVLGATLPARTVEAGRATDTMVGDLARLMTALDGAHARATALSEPIAQSRASIDAAADAFAVQRAAIEAAGQALVVELEQARQLIADVEEQTRDTSLAAATRLVDAMTRVREVANQTAGTMRETLDGVIGEARGSLSAVADDAMRRAFVAPITDQARAAGQAAADASAVAAAAVERTAASLLALAGTVKAVEARTAQASDSLEALIARDLNASTQLLTDRMAATSAALAAALDKPLSDADVAAWQKGERSLFNNRAVTLLGRTERRVLRSRLEQDVAFAEQARRHVAEFDALVARVGGDGPLAAALRQSDSGRVAMILTEAMTG